MTLQLMAELLCKSIVVVNACALESSSEHTVEPPAFISKEAWGDEPRLSAHCTPRVGCVW